MNRTPLTRMLAMADDALSVGDLVRDQQLFTLPVGLTTGEAATRMAAHGFGVAPLTEVPITRYVLRSELADGGSDPLAHRAHRITDDQRLEEQRPLSAVLEALREQAFVFVRHHRHITGLITRADLAQPAISLLVFGLILTIEGALDHLIDRASSGTWLELLSDARRAEVEAVHARRLHADADLAVIRCLNLDDRLALTKKLGLAAELGFDSNSRLREWTRTVTAIRDGLAHGETLLGVIHDPLEALEEVARIRAVAVAAWAHADDEAALVDSFGLAHVYVTDEDVDRPLTGPQALTPLPGADHVIVITAENPAGKRASPAHNGTATAKMAGELAQSGQRVHVGRSGADGWFETSFVVEDMDVDDARELGRRYGQHSIFVIDEQERRIVRCEDGAVVARADRRA